MVVYLLVIVWWQDYKRVVHDVEVFLWKADVEHRLAGSDSSLKGVALLCRRN